MKNVLRNVFVVASSEEAVAEKLKVLTFFPSLESAAAARAEFESSGAKIFRVLIVEVAA